MKRKSCSSLSTIEWNAGMDYHFGFDLDVIVEIHERSDDC